MRTDTKTFRNRMFRDLRNEGLTSRKAKAAAAALVYAAETYGFPQLADNSRARVSFDSIDTQQVYVDDDGIARFCTVLAPIHQPLISTEATAEQIALRDEMEAMMCGDLYEAGGEEKKRLNAIYTAKRDAVLAINPYVHANVADPDGYEFYHNIHKSEYGFRPRGFLTYAMMREKIAMICSRSNERKAA